MPLVLETDPSRSTFWMVQFSPDRLALSASASALELSAPGPFERYRAVDKRVGLYRDPHAPEQHAYDPESLTLNVGRDRIIRASQPPDYDPQAIVVVQGPALVVNRQRLQLPIPIAPEWATGLAWMPGNQLAIGVSRSAAAELADMFQRHGAIMALQLGFGGIRSTDGRISLGPAPESLGGVRLGVLKTGNLDIAPLAGLSTMPAWQVATLIAAGVIVGGAAGYALMGDG